MNIKHIMTAKMFHSMKCLGTTHKAKINLIGVIFATSKDEQV